MSFYSDLDKYASNVAIITEQAERLSYRALLDAADRIGALTKTRSLVFAVCANCFESVAGYVGFLRAGTVPLLVHNRIDGRLFANLIEAYRPCYVYLPTESGGLEVRGTTLGTCGRYTLLRTDFKMEHNLHADLGLLVTTSGSTGSPKFVRQSYRNIDSNAESIVAYLGIRTTDRAISTMPMSYTYMLSIINSHLLRGASIILTEASLMESRFWRMFRENGATTFGGVPYTYDMLKKLRFERMKLPSLEYVTQAGGKLSRDLCVEFADICERKGVRFFAMYGQTEATARMSYLPSQAARTKAGSIGIAIPGGELWIEDERGNVIAESDTTGELVYKGDNVTLGYAESYRDLHKGDENMRVLHTGDVAKRDSDGFYYITGRKKRFLKMYGQRVNLDELENLIQAMGYDCACAGRDDKLNVFVTAVGGEAGIRTDVARRTGINQAGIRIVHIDELPRGETGKIRYSELERLGEG